MTEPDTPDFVRTGGTVEPMEVFLVPGHGTSYELYCEPPDADHSQRSGVTGRVFHRVREMLAAEPAAHPEREGKTPSSGWTVRVRAGAVRRMAEWVAEQRLLWHLRHQDTATLVFPDDIEAERALSIVLTTLRCDRDRHRFWMVVDGLATAVFGPLFFFVPGPNLISWYFAAKTVGHWLAFQGARRGVDRLSWSERPSGSLTAVRDALTLSSAERHRRLGELAAELDLAHLATFIQRTGR